MTRGNVLSLSGAERGTLLTGSSMGSSRFVKTIRARHKQGPLVVKVFVKPDVSLSLKQIYRRLKSEPLAMP